MLLRHGDDHRIFQYAVAAAAQRGVGRYEQTGVAAVIDQTVLLHVRMNFDLVHFRPDACPVVEFLDRLDAEVRYADVACQFSVDQFFHRFPCQRERNLRERDQIVLALRHTDSFPEGERPMDQVQVDVVEPQIGQGSAGWPVRRPEERGGCSTVSR